MKLPQIGSLIFLTVLAIRVAVGNDYEFSLPSIDGDVVKLQASSDERAVVVCFVGNECPLARHYVKRLSEMSTEFGPQGVRFFGVNSNQQDSLPELKTFAKELEVNFKILKDYDNEVADRFKAKRTPEVFVLDNELNLVYRGRVDNQYSPGVNRSVATETYLRDSLEELLNSKPVSLARTDPVGCIIGRVKHPTKNPTVTYTNQVSRLIQKHCLECHRTGEIGPFALDSYDEVKGWAEMMVEVVDDGRMPPWHATADYSKFENERHLTDDEKKIFSDWLAQGTPFGNAEELPEDITFVEGWRLPKEPDLIVPMRQKPFVVQATGTVEYQYFVVDPGFKEDKWVAAAEVIPGNRSVVHHSIVFIRPPDGVAFRGIGWLTAFVPGQSELELKPTHAKRIPAGSKLVFQQHYTPTGTAQEDITKVGLVFADPEQVTHEVYTLASLNQEFEIPAEEDDYLVKSKLPRFPKNGHLLSVGPHMHYRGKSFKLKASSKGQATPMLFVPGYDFNWQHVYQFSEPVSLKDVDDFEMEFRFDNSTENPFNPDAKQMVTWGDQTWEEMAVAFFEVAQPRNSTQVKSEAQIKASNAKIEKQAMDFVEGLFDKFDKNGNRELVRDEMPRAIRRFGFSYYDYDGDGKLTESELMEYARWRFSE